MSSQLTAIIVAAVAVTAVSGGAVLLADPGSGETPASASGEAAIEASTPTPQPSQANEQSDVDTEASDPTEQPETTDPEPTDTETSEEVDTASTTSVEAGSVERANAPPTADAGANETVREWVRVTLDATASTDVEGNLTYEWQQIDGQAVGLEDEGTAEPNFLAPEVTDRTNLTFEVTVTDEDGATATDTVTVTVRPPKATGYSPPFYLQDDEEDTTDENEANEDESDSGSSDSDGSDSSTGGDSGADDSEESDSDETTDSTASRDEIAQAKFDADFASLNAERAGVVEELYLRQPDGDWDPDDVATRDELAREAYGSDFDEIDDTEARIDVQETFDAQFGDTGGEVEKTEITQAKWDHDFRNVSAESAGHVTELYDRQPWADEDQDLQRLRTRDNLAVRLYDIRDADDLTREQRIELEQHYHAQFAE